MTPPRPWGLPPQGSLTRPPQKYDHREKPLLEHKCSNKGLGATIEGVNRGYPNKRFMTERSKDKSRMRLDNPVQTYVHQSRSSTHNVISTLASNTEIQSSE